MESNPLLNLSPSNLRRAAELKERIDDLNSELAEILGGGSVSSNDGGRVGGGKRKMSMAGRARIAAAARARWAKVRARKDDGGSASEGNTAGKKKRL